MTGWTAGHPGRSTVSPAVGSPLIHIGTPSLAFASKTSFLLEKLFLVINLHCDCHSGGDSCFFLVVSHVPAHSWWLVKHGRVAQLPLIGTVHLGNFETQNEKFKLRGIAEPGSRSCSIES